MQPLHSPAEPGTYALLLTATAPLEVVVGRLGACRLPAGHYVYVGSAHGPGGLAARLTRHCRAPKRPHWHIDYLTAILPVAQVLYQVSAARLECAWVQKLLALPGATAPIPGFGNGDCRAGCPAHLVRLPDGYDPAHLADDLAID